MSTDPRWIDIYHKQAALALGLSLSYGEEGMGWEEKQTKFLLDNYRGKLSEAVDKILNSMSESIRGSMRRNVIEDLEIFVAADQGMMAELRGLSSREVIVDKR